MAKTVAHLSSKTRRPEAPRAAKPPSPQANAYDAGTPSESTPFVPPPSMERRDPNAHTNTGVQIAVAVEDTPLAAPTRGASVAKAEGEGARVNATSSGGGNAGGGELLLDWNRDADGQVETIRRDLEGVKMSSSGTPSCGGHHAAHHVTVGDAATVTPTVTPSVEGASSSAMKPPGAAGLHVDDGERSGDEIEDIEMMVEEEEEDKKEKEDSMKHRVWFWQDKLPHTDQYVLRWETNWLVTLGKSVEVSPACFLFLADI